MFCKCDQLTGRCVVCDVPDAFCGSLRNCTGVPSLAVALGAGDAQPAPPSHGPGTELKKLLARVGIVATDSCPCNARAAEMDARGCEWCEANIETIVGWLREQAEARGLPFLDVAGRLLVRRAIQNARRNA
jgi:hypothetical protein